MKFSILILISINLGIASSAQGQNLSQRAIYERCFSKLVRTTPGDADPFAQSVANGTLTGPAACKRLLELAKFESTNRIPAYTSQPEQKKLAMSILHSMNDLHFSWIAKKKFESASKCLDASTASLIDSMEPALFFTRALFHPAYKLDSVLTSSDNLRAIRTVDVPTRSTYSNFGLSGPFTGFPSDQKMIANGGLLGIENGYNPLVPITGTKVSSDNSVPAVTNYNLFANLGGGVLGSQAYILNNFLPDQELVPDLMVMPRSWGKYVFSDLLCRDLPVVTAADALPYEVCPTCAIKPTAAEIPDVLPFRQNVSCVQCHVSMDQVIGGVRNLRGGTTGKCGFGSTPPVYSAFGWFQTSATQPKSYSWGYKADVNYRKRPAVGKFFYRTYDDTLMDLPFDNLQQLGSIISETNDFYVCAAKRYYRYFTGIDVDITPMSSTQENALPADQKFYRQRVIDLGLKLKSPTQFNRDSLKLIQAIFDLPEYKTKDFNLEKLVGAP